MSRGLSTLGSRMASGSSDPASCRSSAPHSPASGLMRMTISGPPATRSFMKAASFSRAADLLGGRDRVLEIEDHRVAGERGDLGQRPLVRSRHIEHGTARAVAGWRHFAFMPRGMQRATPCGGRRETGSFRADSAGKGLGMPARYDIVIVGGAIVGSCRGLLSARGGVFRLDRAGREGSAIHAIRDDAVAAPRSASSSRFPKTSGCRHSRSACSGG